MTSHNGGRVPGPAPRTLAGQKAADKRWGRNIERATHQGTLQIADQELDCVVLEDGRRVISQASILALLGRSTSSGRRTRNQNRPPFLEANNLTEFISPELWEQLIRIDYRVGESNTTRTGYNAEILPRICDVYLTARSENALAPTQAPAAEASERVVRALSLVGITALVDEATGYQETRAKDELQKLLQAYVAEEFRPWIRKFPETFFMQVYRLHGWEFRPGNHQHPGYTGKFINEFVYDELPEGVLDRLRELNPANEAGNRPRKHHQHLTEDQGVNHLEQQIQRVITLMQVSRDKSEFKGLFQRLHHPDDGIQDELDLS